MGRFSEKKILLIIVLASLAIRLIIAWFPLEWMLVNGVIVDDTFYYLTIARNIADGSGVTFDRLSPTDGFHPFWMALLIPIFIFENNNFLAIHEVLSLCAIIGAASIFLLYLIFFSLNINPKVKMALVGFYALSPMILISVSGAGSMNGLETALNIFFILLYVLAYLKIKDIFKFGNNLLITAILFGLASAAVFLTRTDNAIMLIITWLFLSVQFVYGKNWNAIKGLIISALFCAAAVLPWFSWLWINFGEIIQVSGKAMPFVAHEQFSLDLNWNFFNYGIQYIKNIFDSILYFSGILVGSKYSFYFISFLALVSAVAATAVFSPKKYEEAANQKKLFKERIIAISPFIVTLFLFLSVQTARAIILRPWYYLSMVPLIFLAVGIVAEYFWATFNKENKVLLTFLKAAAALYFIIFVAALAEFVVLSFSPDKFMAGRSNQLGKYKMAQELNLSLPQNSIVGSWNAGIYGYFFEKGKIVNLDGVVNNKVFPYIKKHKISVYARQVGVKYLVDVEKEFLNNYWGKQPPIKDIEIIKKISDPNDTFMVLGKIIN